MRFADSEQALHDEAAQATGLEDFGDDAYREGLRILLEAIDAEARVSAAGEVAVRGMIVNCLVGRLRSEQGFAMVPELEGISIEQPLVVTGLPRTGTTALHHLLSQDPQLQGLPLWIAETPKPRPPREHWVQDADFLACSARMQEMHRRSPDMKAIHWIDAELVDECWHLLAQDFAHSGWEAQFHVPSYSRWYAQHRMGAAYRRHKRNLQLIGSSTPEKRWLLKDSTHLFDLGSFLEVYPDARIVHTHRDPLKLIPSVCSLCWSVREALNEDEERAAFGPPTQRLWERAIRGTLAVRERSDPGQFYDLQFRDFVADPLGSIRAIYDHFELEWSPVAEAAMREWQAHAPRGKHGTHHYRFEDWGLCEESLREAFADYVQTFDVPEESR